MRVRRKPVAMPEREAELCERFAAAAREQGWDVFPEVAGWDLVLVFRGAPRERRHYEPRCDARPGDQLALEAKMRASVDALAQAHQRSRWQGPDFRGVLVPEASRDFRYLAGELRLHTFDLSFCGPWKRKRAPTQDRRLLSVSEAMRWDRDRRLWLPPIPLQGPGGQPSPRRLTRWRIAALRLCVLLRSRGWLTSEDFRREKISIATWRDRWIRADHAGPREGKLVRYLAVPDVALPDAGYEAERDALSAA